MSFAACRRLGRRALVAGLAAGTVIAGLVGAYGYGEAYSLHRGFTPIVRLAGAGRGRMVTVHFYSPALHRRADYLVYLPPGYSPRDRYPVYYLLHGAPGAPNAFTSIVNLDVLLANRLSQKQLRPMLLVMPDGRINGNTFSDSEWANTRSGQFESYVIDVVHDVDHRFATIAQRQDRVIAGYSAGAYGAINIALHQLPTFGNVQVWSGYYLQTHNGVFAHASPALMAYNSPLMYARTLGPAIAANPLRAYLFVGRSDPAAVQIAPMASELARDGALVSYSIFPGGHDWSVWYSRVDSLLLMASRMVSEPLPAPVVAHRPAARAPLAAPTRGSRAHHRPGTPRLAPAAARTVPAAARRAAASGHTTRARRAGGLHPSAWLGLGIALISSALINLGFLLQHRGVSGAPEGARRMLRTAFTSPSWLAGQALGWLGFLLGILAVALAPLSLVQAFAAGGLALAVPLGALAFGLSITRRQILAVATIAVSLFILPLGVPATPVHLDGAALAAIVGCALAIGALIASRAHPAPRAVAAGIFYGVADAAIKADALTLRLHGLSALRSGWTAVIVLGTVAGFLSFQAALRAGHAVNAISLMTALTTLTALAFGLLVFGESLGAGPAIVALHLVAVGAVLASVPRLAGAGEEEIGADAHGPRRRRLSVRRALVTVAGGAFAGVALVLSLLAGFGILYLLRGQAWPAAGPRVGDALPLLQLAGRDAQPLSAIVVAWTLAGLAFGTAMVWARPGRRALAGGAVALLLMLFASQAAAALARNLRLSDVLGHRLPGPGAWLEVAVFALAAWLPRRVGSRVRWPRRVAGTRPRVVTSLVEGHG